MTSKPLRYAATVLVLRPVDDAFEVFMVKRSQKSPFMPNVYVYPGGALDSKDCHMDAFHVAEGIGIDDVDAMFDNRYSVEQGIGLLLAAVRETFEESGLLFARFIGEPDPVALDGDVEITTRFAAWRQKLKSGQVDMLHMIQQEHMMLLLDQLGLFAHWITPFVESRRFDTFFFVARAPAQQTPIHDDWETVDSTWLRPKDAVERYYSRDIELAPPTLATLLDLAKFDSIDEVFAFCNRSQPPVILPHFDARDDGMHLLLPNDEDFPSEDPAYEVATKGGDWLKMILKDGLWYPTST